MYIRQVHIRYKATFVGGHCIVFNMRIEAIVQVVLILNHTVYDVNPALVKLFTFICSRQVGWTILTAVSEEVFTSTLQSKSTSRGRDTRVITLKEKKIFHNLLNQIFETY